MHRRATVSSPSRPGARAPYQRKAGQWVLALRAALESAGVGTKVVLALMAWSAASAQPWAKDWTPHQLAKVGSCDPTTVRRALPLLEDAGLVVEMSPACHELRQAAVYRLTEEVPSFASKPSRKRLFSSSQNAKCPSPGILPASQVESIVVPQGPSQPETPQENPSHPEPLRGTLDGDGQQLAEVLEDLGADGQGARAIARQIRDRRGALALLADAGREILEACRKEAVNPERPWGLLGYRLAQAPGKLKAIADEARARRAAQAEVEAQAPEAFRAQVTLCDETRAALAHLVRLQAARPAPASPGHRDHLALEDQARAAVASRVEGLLGDRCLGLRLELERGLMGAGLQPGSVVWDVAWRGRWTAGVLAAAGIAV